jgi:hypothetical protein
MKGFMKRLSVTLLVVMMVFGTCTTAFAKEELENVVKELSEYKNSSDTGKKAVYDDALDAWKKLKGSDDGQAPVEFGGTTLKFTNNTIDDSAGTVDENYEAAYETMKEYLDKIGETSTDVKTVQGANKNLKTVVSTLDAEADISGAAGGLTSLMPLVNQITGMIIMILLLGMAIFTALDVAYLVFPVAKQQMDSAGQSGNKAVSRTDSKTGEATFRWVSDDAVNAYQQATEVGKNPLLVYLKNRVISYILVAVVIFMLMSGNLSVIIEFVLNMLESFFNMLGNLSVS